MFPFCWPIFRVEFYDSHKANLVLEPFIFQLLIKKIIATSAKTQGLDVGIELISLPGLKFKRLLRDSQLNDVCSFKILLSISVFYFAYRNTWSSLLTLYGKIAFWSNLLVFFSLKQRQCFCNIKSLTWLAFILEYYSLSTLHRKLIWRVTLGQRWSNRRIGRFVLESLRRNLTDTISSLDPNNRRRK